MSLWTDLQTLYHLLLAPTRGNSHQARLESFYGQQAPYYDSFRQRLLQGREQLFAALQLPDDGVWVDMGGGTGLNAEHMHAHIRRLRKVYIVDLSPSMLAVAKQRVERHGWQNVELVEADASSFTCPEPADVITFAYSLTMIPDWFAAIECALANLKPAGQLGVIDFYIGRKYAQSPKVQHAFWTRFFWQLNLYRDNVFISADHVPFLEHHLDPKFLHEGRTKVPYLPLARVPYYVFVGHKLGDLSAPKEQH